MKFSRFGRNIQIPPAADVIIRVGLNLRAGQRLFILAAFLSYPLARTVATSAYNAGARLADIVWVDEEITHTHLKNATEDELEEIPTWMSNAALEFIENGDPLLNIVSRNPDLLSDIEPERVSKFQTANLKKWEKFYDYLMRDAVNWSVISSPTKEWALKIFPDCTGEQAVERLWEAIFQTCTRGPT